VASTGYGFPGCSPRPWLRPGAGVLDRLLDKLLDKLLDRIFDRIFDKLLDADRDFNGVQVSSLWLGMVFHADHDPDRVRVSRLQSSPVASTRCGFPRPTPRR
jgi:hypothetical protein